MAVGGDNSRVSPSSINLDMQTLSSYTWQPFSRQSESSTSREHSLKLCKIMRTCGMNWAFAVSYTSASYDKGQSGADVSRDPFSYQCFPGNALRTISGNHRISPKSFLNIPNVSNFPSNFARGTLLAAAIRVHVHLDEMNVKSASIPAAQSIRLSKPHYHLRRGSCSGKSPLM